MRDVLLVLITLLGMGIGFLPMLKIGDFLEKGGFQPEIYRSNKIFAKKGKHSVKNA